jgi:ribulose-5-phosphate 4-epimerase/fuculose-1-phosphate aldolase
VRLSDGARLDGGAEVEGLTNETATMIHAPLQRAGHAAVVHTHTAAGNAVASTVGGLLPLTQQAMLARPFLRDHPYDALALGGPHEGEAMARALAQKEAARGEADARVLLLRHHGLLSVGATMGEAFLWMEWVEGACRYQVAAGAPNATTSLHAADPEVVARTAAQGRAALGVGGPVHWGHPRFWRALCDSLGHVREP